MKKALCVAFALLISVSFATAQNNVIGLWGLHSTYGVDKYFNFNQSVGNARSMGMGGVYYGFDNQSSGSFLNPAGMIFTQKPMLNLDLFTGLDKHRGAPVVVYTPDFYDPSTGYEFYSNVTDIDNSHSRFDQAGAVAPFYQLGRQWWFGGGFRTVLDLHSEYNMPSYLDDEEVTFTEHQGIDAINFALATEAMPQLGFGVNFNIYVRGYEQNFWRPYDYVDSYGDTLAYELHSKDKSTFSGVSFDFGGLYDLDIVKIGAVVSTGYTLTQNSLLLQAQLNDYGEDVGLLDRVKMKSHFPMTYGGGVAFTPMDNFSLGLDFTIRPYSKVRIDVNPEQNLYLDTTGYDPGWEDLKQLRIGAEYVLDAGFGKVPLRAGLQNIPAVYNAGSRTITIDTVTVAGQLEQISEVTSTSGDQFNTYVFSFGTGLKLEKIWFDAAYQYGTSSYSQAETIDLLGDVNSWDRSVEYKYSRFFFTVGMLF